MELQQNLEAAESMVSVPLISILTGFELIGHSGAALLEYYPENFMEILSAYQLL